MSRVSNYSNNAIITPRSYDDEKDPVFDRYGGYTSINQEKTNNLSDLYPLPAFYFPRRFFMLILGFIGISTCYIIRVLISVAIIPMAEEYNWGDSFKGVLLSGFFMGYLLTQIPAQFLCDRFGGAKVFLVGISISSICTILVPVASKNDGALVFLRVITGLTQGIAFPTMNWLIKRWFPVSQRSSSASLIWSGVYIGTIVADFSAPSIIENIGWIYCFYIFGSIGCCWGLMWMIIIRDEPKDVWGVHPNEVAFIKADTDKTKTDKESAIEYLRSNSPNYNGASESSPLINGSEPRELPYLEVVKRLLSASPVWALLYYNITCSWGFYLLLMWYPSWIQREIGLEVGNTLAFYTVLPYICAFVQSNASGMISDRLLRRGVKKVYLRKLFGLLSAILPGVALILVSYVPMSKQAKLALMTIGISSSGYNASGSNIVTLDFSPDYASTTMGISNFISTIPGILGPLLAGLILAKTNGSWTPIFMISSACYLSASLVWVAFIKTDPIV
eukprot:gene7596-9340_t